MTLGNLIQAASLKVTRATGQKEKLNCIGAKKKGGGGGRNTFYRQMSVLYNKIVFRKAKAREGVSSPYLPKSVGGQVQMEIKVHLNRGMVYQHLV